MIRAEGLGKSYGDFVAVRGIDFDVRRGECFGFLGPNGAGKTSTMRMIYRATPVGSGLLEILGHEVGDGANDRAIKRRVGVVPQDFDLDDAMSMYDNLAVFARFYGLYGDAARARIDEVVELVSLQDCGDKPVGAMSGGQQRRVQIARGLLGDPDILVLDEPSTGLDPSVRHLLWEALIELKRRDTTLILTTHYMDEAEKLCDRLLIMDRGKVVAEGTPAALIAEHAPPHVVELPVAGDAEAAALRERFGSSSERVARLADRLLFYTTDHAAFMHALLDAYPEHDTTLRHSNLEDAFLHITGRGLTSDKVEKLAKQFEDAIEAAMMGALERAAEDDG